ncbi:Cobalamin (vitamin B12) biosynthesis CbiB [Candidatus Magnetobacterium bavaricum]|uniref:Cobalamin biosynthesis protein CobD n=1 Tax=Candidatus Magnetobacterium bavaricum TaxID=29290 RepID=A0A0F3GIA8_9BACT|nr:Cobalamin (vitamin B12) biosynthesis CbiB [Candidatus Magnetobacterium bavaricum]
MAFLWGQGDFFVAGAGATCYDKIAPRTSPARGPVPLTPFYHAFLRGYLYKTIMMTPTVLLLAFVIDVLVGDPRWLPHPISLIGRAISIHERLLRRFSSNPTIEVLLGGILTVSVVGLTYLAMLALTGVVLAPLKAYSLLPGLSYYELCLGVIGSFAVATHGLLASVSSVYRHLRDGDLIGARGKLAHVVGRDTQSLTEDAVIRAAIETLAENASDAIIAPMLYFAIGGVELAFAYKAVNTIDSMIGYKNKDYLYFGRIGARVDDVVNFIPARMTAILICISALVLRGVSMLYCRVVKDWMFAYKDFDFMEGMRVLLRDGSKHTSPNAGMPEAAIAGVLDARLGGPSSYAGVVVEKPFIGNDTATVDVRKIGRALMVVKVVAVIGFLISMVIAILVTSVLSIHN